MTTINSYVDELGLSWPERYIKLEEHHIKETEALAKRPRLSVAIFVLDNDNRLILGKRGKGPNYGRWVVPGGKIEWREHWKDAAKREYKEETGLEIAIPEDDPKYVEVMGENEHRFILCTRGVIVGGIMEVGSDLMAIGQFDKNLLNDIDISPVAKLIMNKFGW